MTSDLTALPTWPQRACRDNKDPDAFHVRDDEAWHEAQPRLLATARHYCQPCPIRALCRVAGRQRREWGVWGGVAYRGGTTGTELLTRKTQGA